MLSLNKRSGWDIKAREISLCTLALLIVAFFAAVFLGNDGWITVRTAVIGFVVSEISAAMCYNLASAKGYHAIRAYWIGAFTNILGLIYYAGLPQSPDYVNQIFASADRLLRRIAQETTQTDIFDVRDE